MTPDMSSLARHRLSSSSPLSQALSSTDRTPGPCPRSVAVIGAGAAGMVAARELRREGHRVVVFERRGAVGGTWVYDADVESDPLGTDPSREVVHSSLYESLRTNLPRESMGFLDYPFVPRGGEGRDPRRFPGHREVLRYLEDFSRDFDLRGLVRFGTEVLEVVEMAERGGWAVRSRQVTGRCTSEIYDGVVVCIGHYTEPRIAEVPGIDAWPGKQMHSHNYRVPQPFLDQVVVVIGNSASAVDISRDISGFAKEVHIASRSRVSGTPIKQPGYDNIWLHTMIAHAEKDGTVVFLNGSSLHVDVILHCTGYKYHFPFLKTNGFITVDDNCVGPLYKHIFPPSLAPRLSFIGIPWKVIPFPMFELQSKWVAGVLSGRIDLPNREEMMGDVKASYKELETVGWPKRYTHNISNYQFEYHGWLAAECGHPGVEKWRKKMYYANAKNRDANPEGYRDEWEDDHLITEALEDFEGHWSNKV